MTTNLRAVRYVPHTFPHVGPVRPSLESGNVQNHVSSGNMPHAPRRIVQDRAEQDLDVRPDSQAHASSPRRMVAVTVALSEPMDSEPLDWPATIASLMRLTYANTTVEVIDTWRVDE